MDIERTILLSCVHASMVMLTFQLCTWAMADLEETSLLDSEGMQKTQCSDKNVLKHIISCINAIFIL